MLYTIFIDQVSAMEDPRLKSLDIIDLAIYDCLQKVSASPRLGQVIRDGSSVWCCIPINLISEMLPLLRDSEGIPWEMALISERIEKIANCGVLNMQIEDSGCLVYRGEIHVPEQEKEPIGKRKLVYERDGYRCLKCGDDDVRSLVIDHVLPIAKGGNSKLCNLQTLCWDCNSKKGTNYVDYRAVQIPLDQLYIVSPIQA